MVDFSNIFHELEAKGYSPAAAAGLTGNFGQESGGNPAVMGDGGTSGGYGQWHNERFSNLQHFAAGQGQPWQSPAVQIAFADQEIRANPGLFKSLQGATDPRAAADLVSNLYERPNPAYANNPRREAIAAQVFGAPGPTVERAQQQFGTVGLPATPVVNPAAASTPVPNPTPAPPANPMADLASSLTGAVSGANVPAPHMASLVPQPSYNAPPTPDPQALAASLLAGTHGNLVLQ